MQQAQTALANANARTGESDDLAGVEAVKVGPQLADIAIDNCVCVQPQHALLVRQKLGEEHPRKAAVSHVALCSRAKIWLHI